MNPHSGLADGTVAYRLATEDDLMPCAEIWHSGVSDYQGRLNLPTFPLDLEPVRRLLAHIRSTDPGMFWVATREQARSKSHDRIVGFGSAHVRGSVWFLAMLFVYPTEQSRGIGRELLLRTFPDGQAPRTGESLVLATATDSAQPISNGLYGQYGIVPQLPVFQLVGRPAPGTMPRLPEGISATAFPDVAQQTPTRRSAGMSEASLEDASLEEASLDEVLNSIDLAILGYEHPEEHRWLRLADRQGFLYRRDGQPVGYAYTSALGRVGPIAALQPELLSPIGAHVLDAVVPRGASSMRVAGASTELFSDLLRAGFRIEEFPTLMCWNRPFADFARYVPGSPALI